MMSQSDAKDLTPRTHRYTMQTPQDPIFSLLCGLRACVLQRDTKRTHALGHDMDGRLCLNAVKKFKDIRMSNGS